MHEEGKPDSIELVDDNLNKHNNKNNNLFDSGQEKINNDNDIKFLKLYFLYIIQMKIKI